MGIHLKLRRAEFVLKDGDQSMITCWLRVRLRMGASFSKIHYNKPANKFCGLLLALKSFHLSVW